jgi:hypothetical protein
MAEIVYIPSLSPEDALRIFRDPKSHVFINIQSVEGAFELTFEMFNYRAVRVLADRSALVALAQTMLDMAIVPATIADPDIDDEQHDRCVSSIIDEVAAKGRYGNRPGGEQSSEVVVVTA